MFELVIFCGLYFTYFKKRFAGLLQLVSEEIWLSPMSDSINKHAYLHKFMYHFDCNNVYIICNKA